MDDRKHVALITAWFEPLESVAANRMNSIAKHIDKERFRLTVIARNDGNELHEIRKDGVQVYRITPSKLFKRRRQTQEDPWLKRKLKSVNNRLISLLFVGDFPGWSKRAIHKLDGIHRVDPVDVVMTSYGPLDACEVGYHFVLRFPDVKWLADMRDEMSLNPFFGNRRKRFLAKKERQYASHVSAITTVSEPILNDFKRIFKEVNYAEEVRNGFDHNVELHRSFNEQFTIVYAGSLYGKNKPSTFFQALVELVEEELLTDFLIRFVGTTRNFAIPTALRQHIEFVARVPLLKSIEHMENADCNLLLMAPLGTMGRYTGKIFDYLSVEKPILALVDVEDVGAQLIREHNCGIAADFYDVEAIKRAILHIHAQWRRKELPEVDPEKTKSLHRRIQVKKLENVLTKLSTP